MVAAISLFFLFSFTLHAQVFLPETPSHIAEEIVQHQAYTLSYNENHEVANWVAYSLRPDLMQDCVQRKNDFRVDPEISTGSANLSDYKGSGFDRGHLVPAGDMKWHKSVMSQTFYMSNMTPQFRNFNGGAWGKLETAVRAWVMSAEETYIVSGPILHDKLPVIGENEVSVPEEHFKIILQINKGKYQMIGFIMPSHTPFTDLTLYGVPVDQIEARTGIDFFSFLPDHIEDRLEAQYDPKNFHFNARFEYKACKR